MIIQHRENTDVLSIDTGRHDPVMIVGLLQSKVHEMYDISVEDEKVVVRQVPYIELLA